MRYEEVFSYEHLLFAALACCKGVRWKSSTQVYEATLPMKVAELHDQLMSCTWKSKGFNTFYIWERGKTRKIQAVHITERTVQKCLVHYGLRPLIMPRLIAHSYATLPGKGTEAALKQHKEHLRWWYARHKREGCIVTMDYRDYFASVSHAKLKAMYARLPMDECLYQLTCYLIDCFDGEYGLGLGSEISQISSLLYINSVDHLAKDQLGIHCYGRYMDDAYLIADKQQAEVALNALMVESKHLGLVFNEKATQLRPLTQGWHYLKKRVQLTDNGRVVMRLERENIKRARQRINKNAELVAAGTMTLKSAEQSLQSWLAYARRYNTWGTANIIAGLNDARGSQARPPFL